MDFEQFVSKEPCGLRYERVNPGLKLRRPCKKHVSAQWVLCCDHLVLYKSKQGSKGNPVEICWDDPGISKAAMYFQPGSTPLLTLLPTQRCQWEVSTHTMQDIDNTEHHIAPSP